jgi:ADP-ribosylglycohydrolase
MDLIMKHSLFKKGIVICFAIGFWLIFLTCKSDDNQKPFLAVKPIVQDTVSYPLITLQRDQLYDKILGSLVGSAIGDALGAPTEMWERPNMQVEYGYIDSLQDMIREPSPEGIWEFNMQAGSTTDDTRWKVLMSEYLLDQNKVLYQKDGPTPESYAQFVLQKYQREVNELKKVDGLDPEPFEQQLRRMTWLQEWAKVAKPFMDGDLKSYVRATNKFYGGEMACAGLLYAPLLGLVYPGSPHQAYKVGYEMSFFDLGYAKDLTALTAAMVSSAMQSNGDPTNITKVHQSVDPEGYFKSRLLGRVAYRIYKDALYEVDRVKSAVDNMPDQQGSPETYENQIQQLYDFLDSKKQDVSFHAAEHLINITAMLWTDFDFKRSLEFVINYGRDNDTVGAVTGSILGALHGYSKLPQDWKNTVVQINKNQLGVDLESIAMELTNMLIDNQIVNIAE